MKTQLAILLLAFASEEASAHNLRRIDEHNQRILKGSSGDAPYRVVEGKKTKTITAAEAAKPTVFLHIKHPDDSKTAKCASFITEELVEEYAVNVVNTEDNIGNVLAPDVGAEIDKPKDDECDDILDWIEAQLGSGNRRSNGAGNGSDSIALFDVDGGDKDLDKCCKGCNKNNACEKGCEDDCDKDCKKNWGFFDKACQDDCKC